MARRKVEHAGLAPCGGGGSCCRLCWTGRLLCEVSANARRGVLRVSLPVHALLRRSAWLPALLLACLLACRPCRCLAASHLISLPHPLMRSRSLAHARTPSSAHACQEWRPCGCVYRRTIASSRRLSRLSLEMSAFLRGNRSDDHGSTRQ